LLKLNKISTPPCISFAALPLQIGYILHKLGHTPPEDFSKPITLKPAKLPL
jgi:hypothetical protein